ncbi:MAG: DUF342 domain-containing protein, partial [Victivallales bacterium]|nr:DUF342 domain-containing protein [Victivallales bacterium]
MTNEDHDSIEDQILKDLDAMDTGESPGQVEEDSSGDPVVIRISKDKMKAYAKVMPPLDSGHETDKSHVTEKLITASVSFGIDEEAIDEIFTYGQYNVEVVVAKGKHPSDGKSARIDYKFETSENRKVKLEQDEQGNVDHRKVNLIASVEPGTLLAVKIPAVLGETGMTVTGKELPAVEGKDVPLPLGEHVKAMENDTCVVSEIAGQPVLRNERVSVSAVYEVKGDVNYKTGNINFSDTVIVTGNVLSDFEV